MKITYDFDKEHDKDFLREAGKMLQGEVIRLRIENIQLSLKEQRDEEIRKKLTGELLVLRRKIFDSKQEKKEKLKGLKKKKKKEKIDLLHNQNENKNDIEKNSQKEIELTSEEVEYEHKSSCCPHCSDEHGLEEMNNLFEESTEFDVNHTYYILKRHKKKKYKCRSCRKITTAKGNRKLTPGSKFSVQIAAKVACDKFQYHIPLERQRKKMKNSGLIVSAKTLYSITEHLYNLLISLEEKNKRALFEGNYFCLDESPMSYYKDKKHKGQVWSLSNERGAYYQFEETRSGKVAKEMVGDFKGIVMTDGYSGYDFLKKNKDIIHAYCWSHLRRYFFNAMVENKEAGEVVDSIDNLYEVEHNAKDFKNLKYLRKIRSTEIFREIESWVDENEGKYLPSTLTGKAIKYFYNQKEGLSHFLKNELIPLDNNAAERRQRNPVMGRKNYQAFRSINGADVGMFFYSLIESCKTNGLAPESYLVEMALRKLDSQELETPFEYALKLKSKISAKVHEDLKNKILMNTS